MLIQILSDTHDRIDYTINKDVDLIVHAGDFSNNGGRSAIININLFVEKCKEYNKPYVLVLGNHDFYNNNIDKLYKELDENNINYLRSGKKFVFKNKTFVGGTLFTNFRSNVDEEYIVEETKKFNSVAIYDFNCIENGFDIDKYMQLKYKYITPNDYHTMFNVEYNWINKYRNKNDVVVLTHFPMSLYCMSDYYKHHTNESVQMMNKYFINDLNIKGFETIISGHTHNFVDIVKDGCRLIVNPLGYNAENNMMNGNYKNEYVIEI